MKHGILLRIYDILSGILILLIAAIPLLLLIIIKLIADGRPLFFNSKRIGKDRASITVYKFRTMVRNRQFIENYLMQIHSYGFEKIPLDAAVYTKMGRFLERFQIVELLQIINVLKGNMSIIGYRPLPLSHVLQLEEELGTEQIALRHSVLPGITGMSQIMGKTSLTNAERVEVENSYNRFIQTRSQPKIIIYNTLIIIETFLQIISKKVPLINFLKKKILHHTPLNSEIQKDSNYILLKEKSEVLLLDK